MQSMGERKCCLCLAPMRTTHDEARNAMNRTPDSSPHLAVIVVAALVGLLITFGGCDHGPTRPGSGWCGLDTLYESGIPVHHTCDVQAAFEAYVAFVDTTTAEFPSEQDWTYLASRPYRIWRDHLYWQVDHEAYSPDLDKRVGRRWVCVDENGVVVWPYGCI